MYLLPILKTCDHCSGCLKIYLYFLIVAVSSASLICVPLFLFLYTRVHLACVHACVCSPSLSTQALPLCPRLCHIFPTAAIAAASWSCIQLGPGRATEVMMQKTAASTRDVVSLLMEVALGVPGFHLESSGMPV